MALPYSSNLVCAKARLAQYTAFSPFNSMACVYRSIAWEYLWALHTNSAAEKENGINYKENNETRIKSQIGSTIYIIHKYLERKFTGHTFKCFISKDFEFFSSRGIRIDRVHCGHNNQRLMILAVCFCIYLISKTSVPYTSIALLFLPIRWR